MITGFLLFFAAMALLGIGSHASGVPHLFYIFSIAIAKVLIIGIVIGIFLVYLFTGWWAP
ncbi:MAG: hypothetical protein BGO12_09765 [Verrucomicrobia bacterium 61-8]|nr:MAG: hypothetical protein BGO12_09765 [Verrucomicrobia bacterium 61-8]PTX98221.1 hypothetical protein DB345_05140 [Spartobacteria bacterium LR76]